MLARTHSHTSLPPSLPLSLSILLTVFRFCLTFECYVFIAVFNSFGISGVHNKLKVSGCYLLLSSSSLPSSFLSSFFPFFILMRSFFFFLCYCCCLALLCTYFIFPSNLALFAFLCSIHTNTHFYYALKFLVDVFVASILPSIFSSCMIH